MKGKLCTNLVIRHQKNPQHRPYPVPGRTYGADAQKMEPLNTLPVLAIYQVKQIKHIIGKFLYHVRGVENFA